MIYNKYQWRFNNQPVDAQTAGEHLAALEQQHKSLTPEIVLDDARPSNAVLHSCFEWDDHVAAEKHRIWQARYIISNIVVVKKESDTPKTVRAFISIAPLPNKGEFVSIGRAISDERYREQILQNAITELRAFKKKYTDLKELSAVFDAIDTL